MQNLIKAFSVSILLSIISLINASAQQPAPMIGDSDEPIEITADSLTVKRLNEIAVFSGDVVAVQGKLNLRSEVMTVYYKSQKTKGSAENSISKIDVEGNVFLTTPKETAQGNTGLYDVDNKRITLSGDVVVTQKENIIKGSKLIYDLVSGKSELFSDKSLGTSGVPGEKSGRVKGIFVPEKKSDDGAQQNKQ